MNFSITGQSIIAGHAEGELVYANEPLSFWGGYDYATGEIIDRRHPLSGQIAAGKVLALPFTRGSSTTTAVLLEAVRAGTAPAVIITTGVDRFFALAAVVAEEMYGNAFPLVAIEEGDFAKLAMGRRVRVEGETILIATDGAGE
jgi:predicted aconitase with swiveling domain